MSKVDPERLGAVLSAQLGPSGGVFRLVRIGGGQSNLSFSLDWGARRLVLRKQP